MKDSIMYVVSMVAFLMIPMTVGILLGLSWAFDIELGRLSSWSFGGIVAIIALYTLILSRSPREKDAC